MIAGDGGGLRRGINPEKGPRPGDERIFLDNALSREQPARLMVPNVVVRNEGLNLPPFLSRTRQIASRLQKLGEVRSATESPMAALECLAVDRPRGSGVRRRRVVLRFSSWRGASMAVR